MERAMRAIEDTVRIGVECDTKPMTDGLSRLSREAASFSTAITGAFKAAATGGRAFEDVLKELALRIASIAFDAATRPIANAIGGALGGLTSAFGGEAAIQKHARGGVIGGPTLFPLARGIGLAGEAGPEAILPLQRGADGRLGVAGGGHAPMVVHVNVTTPDADSFRRSEAQVTAMLARAVGRGRRGL
jgi:phage-related minor tail protein